MTGTPQTRPTRRRAAAPAPAPAANGYATADDLIEGDLGDGEDVTLPSGRMVRVRGLSRHELFFNGKGTEDSALLERRNVASCLLIPKMTMAQLEAWQRSSSAGGDFKALSEVIRDMSGLGEGADKSGVRPVGE
jgi:hypothetical protein